MEEDRPSATAQRVAMRRAAHQLLDNPKVFDDPLSHRIIGKESASALQADPHQFEATPLSSYLRAFVAARSRYTEDELALGVRRGVSQYVILGAGLDTFAYRNPYPEGVLHVFEVDYPATQTWKRARSRRSASRYQVTSLSHQLTLKGRPSKRGCEVQATIRANVLFFRGWA
ncbi:MAG: class I SAM-dependent methyltransferase [Syntrophales bacterium]